VVFCATEFYAPGWLQRQCCGLCGAPLGWGLPCQVWRTLPAIRIVGPDLDCARGCALGCSVVRAGL